MYPIIALIISFIIGSVLSIPFITSQQTPSSSIPFEEDNKQKDTVSFSIADAPTLSKKGIVTSSGIVTMEQRNSTIAGTLKESETIYQGERVSTDANSSARITFDSDVTILLEENADFSIVQTLPYSFVFLQRAGTSHITKQSDIPVSMRILNATLSIEQGSVSVTVDPTFHIVDVTVNSGSAVLGYNNLNYVSQVVSIREGETARYDNNQRLTTITD